MLEPCGQFVLFYFYSGFQTVFSIRGTSEGFHTHYAVNTASFYDSRKYPFWAFRSDWTTKIKEHKKAKREAEDYTQFGV